MKKVERQKSSTKEGIQGGEKSGVTGATKSGVTGATKSGGTSPRTVPTVPVGLDEKLQEKEIKR